MIKPGEIQNKARQAQVRDQQIEKDYILSWILQGLARHPHLSQILIFKGGTVLKKVYFEDYRFSEDLDFTLLDNAISNRQILEWFVDTFEYIRKEANITLEIADNSELEEGSLNVYIGYIGPLGGKGAHTKVKVDISRNETLVFPPTQRKAILGYTDLEEHELQCYALEEILVEKMRSIMQPMQARDFYNIWYLLEIHGMDAGFYAAEFRAKCENKGIDLLDFPLKLEQRLPQYSGRWRTSLADQIQDLPDFDQVQRAAMRHLKKLEFKT